MHARPFVRSVKVYFLEKNKKKVQSYEYAQNVVTVEGQRLMSQRGFEFLSGYKEEWVTICETET